MPTVIEMAEYGAPDVLKCVDKPIPEPGPGEVVIKAMAIGVNRADCEIRSGKWPIQKANPFPYTPGLEVAGTIYTVGTGVDLPRGIPVLTMMQKLGGIHGIRPGGYQAFVKVPAGTLAVVRKTTNLMRLAAYGLAGVTAFQGISRLQLEKGSRVLIHGGSGGVGSLAIQLAKLAGAHVIATSHRPEKSEALKNLGANEVWSTEKWSAEPVDAVLEMVGGDVFRRSVAALKPKGRLCAVGALTGGEATLSIWNLLHELTLTGWSSEDMSRAELQAAVDHLGDLLDRGLLHKPTTREFPLAKASEAHACMESGDYVGRILLVTE